MALRWRSGSDKMCKPLNLCTHKRKSQREEYRALEFTAVAM